MTESQNVNSSLTSCESCFNRSCCNESGRFASQIPGAFLTDYDIKRISDGTGLDPKEFVNEVIHPITSKPAKYILDLDGIYCKFFDKKANLCSIYEFRPLDCRLFPLDIIFENGKYFWVIYPGCNYDANNIPNLLHSANQVVLPHLKNYLSEYAGTTMLATDQEDYQVLGEVVL